ncbi:MAG: hypothetical protein ACYCPS_03595 [Candidatus Saccharimonadales bacterium]
MDLEQNHEKRFAFFTSTAEVRVLSDALYYYKNSTRESRLSSIVDRHMPEWLGRTLFEHVDPLRRRFGLSRCARLDQLIDMADQAILNTNGVEGQQASLNLTDHRDTELAIAAIEIYYSHHTVELADPALTAYSVLAERLALAAKMLSILPQEPNPRKFVI